MPAATPTIALDRCPGCGELGGDDFELGNAELRRCRTCETVYARSVADPSAIYVDGYYSGETDFGIDIRHPRFQAYLREVNAQRARLLEETVGRPGSALDVGCGVGDLLMALRERGWRVTGVEPIPEAAQRARERGLDVRTGTLEELGDPPGAWDVASAVHLLEHLPDAHGFLRGLARQVRPGGHLFLESPNWASRSRRTQGPRWTHLRPLEHAVHWTPKTLRTTLERAGLEPVSVRTLTWRSELHTPLEAAADVARPWLAGLPSPVSLRAASVARRFDERRGLGMVVWAVARVS
jgi:2-polyprenyl-3-methyl-5-hydroxy-6-metoxy-1,4-benzoquinol methylase